MIKLKELINKKNDCIERVNNGESFDEYNPYSNYKRLWFWYLKRSLILMIKNIIKKVKGRRK